MHPVQLVGELSTVAVARLRTRRDAQQQQGIEALRDMLQGMVPAGAPEELVGRLVQTVERELSTRRGWKFIMVEPNLYAEVVDYLLEHSARPQKAVKLWTRLFTLMPMDSNEIGASRDDLAKLVGIQPSAVSEIMRELAEIGAVYKRREGRGVRYFVNPILGTHLSGAARDKAQETAPSLRIIPGGKVDA